MPYGYKQSRISCTLYPQLGGTLLQGTKIQTSHHKFWLARGRILSLIYPISARKPKKVARPCSNYCLIVLL